MGEFSSSEPQHMGLQLPNRNKLQRKERGGGAVKRYNGMNFVWFKSLTLVQVYRFCNFVT